MLAESPGVYRDAVRCSHALADLRVALHELPDVAYAEPPGDPAETGTPVTSVW
jgi:hypothetical protein